MSRGIPGKGRKSLKCAPMRDRPVDGRTVRGLRIREEVRKRLLAAYIDLLRGGIAAPSARQIAERARLSLRVIFKHFSDLRALRLAALGLIQAQSDEFFSADCPVQGPVAERLEEFVKKHTARLEFVTPIHRTAAMVESLDPDVAGGLRLARDAVAAELRCYLAPALKPFTARQRRALLTELHVVCSWSSWEMLRTHYRLPVSRARAIMTGVALAVLAAERRGISP